MAHTRAPRSRMILLALVTLQRRVFSFNPLVSLLPRELVSSSSENRAVAVTQVIVERLAHRFS